MSTHNTIESFQAALREYVSVAGRDYRTAVSSRAARFSFHFSKRLKSRSPAKGEARTEGENRLKAGKGIKIRAKAIQYARERTVATQTDVRSRRAGAFMETNRKGNLKKEGRTFQQIAVARELNIRESGRGILARGTSFPGLAQKFRAEQFGARPVNRLNRYGRRLARSTYSGTKDGAAVTFLWGDEEASQKLAEALTSGKISPEIDRAMKLTRDDMLEYIARKRRGGAK
jgi:hypothetical protein